MPKAMKFKLENSMKNAFPLKEKERSTETKLTN